jgi:myo-inositol-1(or 4)-monophosphatase
MLNIAIRAAHHAGDFITRKINKVPDLQIEVKAKNDYVSEVDRQAEIHIIEDLLKAFPKHGILAEESGVIKGEEDFTWIIDPLDGTTNFLHGFPHYAVSIACQHQGKLMHGVIYDPFKQELFAASRGDGATLNNRRIRVTNLKTTESALLGTGFPFKNPGQLDEFIKLFSEFFNSASDIRRAGSAALDMAYVAAGRLDGFWESGLHSWDLAAGALIVREAGGLVTDFSGDEHYLEKGQVVAGNPKIIAEMLRKIQRQIGPQARQESAGRN